VAGTSRRSGRGGRVGVVDSRWYYPGIALAPDTEASTSKPAALRCQPALLPVPASAHWPPTLPSQLCQPLVTLLLLSWRQCLCPPSLLALERSLLKSTLSEHLLAHLACCSHCGRVLPARLPTHLLVCLPLLFCLQITSLLGAKVSAECAACRCACIVYGAVVIRQQPALGAYAPLPVRCNAPPTAPFSTDSTHSRSIHARPDVIACTLALP